MTGAPGSRRTTCRWWSSWRSRLKVLRELRRRLGEPDEVALQARAAAPGPPGVVRRDGVAQTPVGDELLNPRQLADGNRLQPARRAALDVQRVDRRAQAAL